VLGGTIARLKQFVDGIPVDGGELHVMTRADGTLVAASGILHSASSPRVQPTWAFGETGAITRVLEAKYKAHFAEDKLVVSYRTKSDTVFAGRSGDLDVSLARAR
jgi:Zn-dependent metalloprotease